MTNNPTIDGVSRELLERLLTDACNENWSDLNELLNSSAACRCRRFGKDNPHWPCPVHSAQVDQHGPTAAMTEAGCQAYMDADGMIGIMHNSSMEHAYVAMRALDPEIATLQSEIERAEQHRNDLADTVVFQKTEVAALQSTIAQLQAQLAAQKENLESAVNNSVMFAEQADQLQERIGELESGRGEPQAFLIQRESCFPNMMGHRSLQFSAPDYPASGNCKVTPLFTAPPDPVVVVMTDEQIAKTLEPFGEINEWNDTVSFSEAQAVKGCRAVLDATAALNGDRK